MCKKIFHKNHLSGKPSICFKCAGIPPPPLHPGTVPSAGLGIVPGSSPTAAPLPGTSSTDIGPGVTDAGPRGGADAVPPPGQSW